MVAFHISSVVDGNKEAHFTELASVPSKHGDFNTAVLYSVCNTQL